MVLTRAPSCERTQSLKRAIEAQENQMIVTYQNLSDMITRLTEDGYHNVKPGRWVHDNGRNRAYVAFFKDQGWVVRYK